MSLPVFLVINRNKSKWVSRAVQGALSQTVPCHVVISDQGSTDNSMSVILGEVENYQAQREGLPPFHKITILECPVDDAYGMRACNRHIAWCIDQLPADTDWIFQCSSDDYSLPDRVSHCLQSIANVTQPVVGICNAMFFEAPGETNRSNGTGFPTASGFVNAGEGLMRLVYGSTIWAYRRDWLLKVGLDVSCTLDVYLGFLAALYGLYYCHSPQHVHGIHTDVEFQMGFDGRLRNATDDNRPILEELNILQLQSLYMDCIIRAQELHPEGIPAEAQNACVQMILNCAFGLREKRMALNAMGIRPGLL